ncbi:unnamed protein product [Sphagnum jensenii]|uniref:Uncharacterized protein n=1 Tax=Sphagnum jensenii TaxID=128206 RepID=A0ABP1BHH0_9BRYO
MRLPLDGIELLSDGMKLPLDEMATNIKRNETTIGPKSNESPMKVRLTSNESPTKVKWTFDESPMDVDSYVSMTSTVININSSNTGNNISNNNTYNNDTNSNTNSNTTNNNTNNNNTHNKNTVNNINNINKRKNLRTQRQKKFATFNIKQQKKVFLELSCKEGKNM